MKKILVPIDFSKKSEEALKVAAKIARKTDAEIHVLHLLDLPMSEVDISDGNRVPKGPFAMMMFEQTHEKFDVLLDKDYLDNISVFEHVLTDAPVEGISHFAVKNKIDLVVMGSHGTSGMDEFFVGSNTEKVVRSSKIPVFVVKGTAKNFKIEKVVIAGKFTGHYIKEFHKIMHFLKIFEPEIYLLRVNTISNFKSTKEIDEIFNKFFKKVPEYKCFNRVVYNDMDVQKGIFHFAEKMDVDLIALATRGRQGIMHFLSDSIAESVVNASHTNILTIKVDRD